LKLAAASALAAKADRRRAWRLESFGHCDKFVSGWRNISPMTAEVTRENFTALEREVEGEKLVTRHILEQTRRNGDDLAAVKSRLDRVEMKLDGVERNVDGLERKFDSLERKLDGLSRNLPKILGDVMRDVLDERDRKA
jgi:predicted  nucleic acid-binding Zn-ribbon protein